MVRVTITTANGELKSLTVPTYVSGQEVCESSLLQLGGQLNGQGGLFPTYAEWSEFASPGVTIFWPAFLEIFMHAVPCLCLAQAHLTLYPLYLLPPQSFNIFLSPLFFPSRPMGEWVYTAPFSGGAQPCDAGQSSGGLPLLALHPWPPFSTDLHGEAGRQGPVQLHCVGALGQ